ncbi:MAG: AAA family ATPase [Nanoarchaeota archaeon]|nr:AAA family ATPase [Nanoarchaeota archaeon]
MIIRIWADFHGHLWQSFGTDLATGLPRRLVDQQKILDQVLTIDEQRGVGLVINGGDMVHKRGSVPIEVINMLLNYNERRLPEEIYVRGNHDLVSDTVYTELGDAVRFLNKGVNNSFDYHGVKVYIVNYFDQVDYEKIKGYDIVVLHKQPAIINEYGHVFKGADWQRLAGQNRLVFFAHYHIRKQLGPNCFIIGTPMHYVFDEVNNDRGIYLVDTDTWKVEFVKLDYPEFRIVDTPDQVKNDGNYYKVLHATCGSNDSMVVNVVTPKHFEERIKSSEIGDIVREWLTINNKPESYLDLIEGDVLSKFDVASPISNIKLAHVDIKDFMSIGEISFDVEQGFTAIFGENGSAKTGIVDAIYWCLFGETTKKLLVDDIIRRGGPKDTIVTCMLSKGDQLVYAVTRSRKAGLVIVDLLTGKEITDGLVQVNRQQVLEGNILGFGKNLFLSSCYFSQEALSTFTQLGDADRTNMVTSLLGFNKYDDLYLAVKDKADLLVKQQVELQNKTVGLEATLQAQESRKSDYLDRAVEFNNEVLQAQATVRSKEAQVAALRQQYIELENTVVVAQGTEALSKRLDEIKAAILKINNDVTKFGEYNTKINTVLRSKSNEIGELSGELKAAKNNKVKVDNEISALLNLETGVRCDKCGNVITPDKVVEFINEKQEEITVIDQQLLGLQSTIDVTQADYNSEQNTLNLNKVAEAALVAERGALTNEQNKVMSEIRLAEVKSKQLSIDLVTLQTRISSGVDEVSLLNSNIVATEEKYNKFVQLANDIGLQINDMLTELTQVNTEISDADINLEILEFWKVAFSAKGIRSLLLDRFCNEFNDIVNNYLSTISNGLMSVMINPVSTLKSGENRNRISVDVIFDGVIVKYASLSGGEKKRVDISMCLTLNKWVSLRYSIPEGLLGIMILDEAFDALDKLGEELTASLLSDEGQTKAVYVISHTPDLLSYADRSWLVEKKDGISSLVYDGIFSGEGSEEV